jgi:hypothetical protein
VTQQNAVFTIVGGTTVPDRAAIVRPHYREGAQVKLRREFTDASSIGVWIPCPIVKGLLKPLKKSERFPEKLVTLCSPPRI